MKVSIKTNSRGECEEFLINGKPKGKDIERVILVIEACKPVKMYMTKYIEEEIECDEVDIKCDEVDIKKI